MIAIMRTVLHPDGGVNKSGTPRLASQYAASAPVEDASGNVTIALWSFDRADAFTSFDSASEADLIAQASDEPTAWGTSLDDVPDPPATAVGPREALAELRREKAEREAKAAEGEAQRAEQAARDAAKAARIKAEQDRRAAMTPEEIAAEATAAEEAALLAELAREEAREAARQERLARAQAVRRRLQEEADKEVTPEQEAAKAAAEARARAEAEAKAGEAGKP
jgi:hypothetical protein